MARAKSRSASPSRKSRASSKSPNGSPSVRQRVTAATVAAVPVSPPRVRVGKPTETKHTRAEAYEFGGPVGTACIMAFSHVILYYVYYVVWFNNGNLWLPTSWAAVTDGWSKLAPAVTPTYGCAAAYLAFIAAEAVLAVVCPGPDVSGRPDEMGNTLLYRCNAFGSWWVTLAVMGTAWYTGFMPLRFVYDNLGRFMTVAVIFGDALSLALYVIAFVTRTTHRMSGNHVYDFFMGASLHPRIGVLDIKLFAEVRVSWFLLFLLTSSCAAYQWSETGTVTPQLQVMCLAHFLYANACAKGEHYVAPTWDIHYEKFGWMLCFWNFAGVPFLYCTQSAFVTHLKPVVPAWLPPVLAVVLLATYYVWDTANSQKNHFRLEFSGVVIKRWTFPILPWQTLENPRFLETANGSPLLVDGWYGYARKIHYTADSVMAFIWGATCGFGHFIPFFYFFFFTSMILHRYTRDMERCGAKYGEDWQRYLKTVPAAFIPGVF